MPKNIGWTKKQSEAIAKNHNKTHLAHHAVAQREDGWPISCTGEFTMQWVVVIQKRKRTK